MVCYCREFCILHEVGGGGGGFFLLRAMGGLKGSFVLFGPQNPKAIVKSIEIYRRLSYQ